jgi:hypothetical protein
LPDCAKGPLKVLKPKAVEATSIDASQPLGLLAFAHTEKRNARPNSDRQNPALPTDDEYVAALFGAC